MKINITILVASLFILTSCGTDYKLNLEVPKTLNKEAKFTAKVSEENGKPIDSVLYFLNGKKAAQNFDLSKERLGNHTISAIAFYGDKTQKVSRSVLHLADKKPVVYNYTIINEFPHDSKSFTQGLEFHDGFLYESTGKHNESSLRKVELKTGKVLQKKLLDKTIFGEGMTIFNDEIHILSWQKYKGYTFNLSDFKFKKDFAYGASEEGWGLTHNDKHLIKSDGTEKIWFLNPTTLKEEYFIEAYTNKRKSDMLNELEYINGKIFSNVWQKNIILIINPNDGAIEGIINLNGLQKQAGQQGADNVLNGIAYDAANDRLFVTGKYWDKVFEIKYNKGK